MVFRTGLVYMPSIFKIIVKRQKRLITSGLMGVYTIIEGLITWKTVVPEMFMTDFIGSD